MQAPTHISLVHPIKYRPDIDGLRAIAVMSVILFHLNPRHFQAGGIGVDIFLVISGYLIGGIVLASVDKNKFSFSEFYLRRIRRIYPAFIVMILVTTFVTLLTFYPQEIIKFSFSGLSAIICSANIFFYFNADYFGDNSSAPLLHTWTLGVEEQFYFIFPFVALIAQRWARISLVILGLILLASLMISHLELRHSSAAAFYLLPSRAWELMAGVIAARTSPKLFGSGWAREIGGISGLTLIAGSLAFLNPAKGFPGLYAAPPCLGTFLLLVSGQSGRGLVHRMLSTYPIRLTGLASYSLYLWHWPIFIFLMHYQLTTKFSIAQTAAALILALIAGFLSWRFVEARFRAEGMSPARLLRVCGLLTAVAALSFTAIIVSGGIPQRFNARTLKLEAANRGEKAFTFPQAKCFMQAEDRIADYDAKDCLSSIPGFNNWVLVGDSHAAMLYGGLQKQPGLHILPAITFGCDIDINARSDGQTCHDLTHLVFQKFLPNSSIKGVILTSRWENVDIAALVKLAHDLSANGQHLVVIGPVPEYSVPVARVLAEANRRGDPSLPARILEPRLWEIDALLRRAAKTAGYDYLSPMRAMCGTGSHCILSNALGIPFYSDGTHYTNEGTIFLLNRLRAIDADEDFAFTKSLGAKP